MTSATAATAAAAVCRAGIREGKRKAIHRTGLTRPGLQDQGCNSLHSNAVKYVKCYKFHQSSSKLYISLGQNMAKKTQNYQERLGAMSSSCSPFIIVQLIFPSFHGKCSGFQAERRERQLGRHAVATLHAPNWERNGTPGPNNSIISSSEMMRDANSQTIQIKTCLIPNQMKTHHIRLGISRNRSVILCCCMHATIKRNHRMQSNTAKLCQTVKHVLNICETFIAQVPLMPQPQIRASGGKPEFQQMPMVHPPPIMEYHEIMVCQTCPVAIQNIPCQIVMMSAGLQRAQLCKTTQQSREQK